MPPTESPSETPLVERAVRLTIELCAKASCVHCQHKLATFNGGHWVHPETPGCCYCNCPRIHPLLSCVAEIAARATETREGR